MSLRIARRTLVLGLGALLASSVSSRARADDRVKIRYNGAHSEQDIRADAIRMFAEEIDEEFEFEPYFASTLFKPGTELAALQRGNIEMAMVEPQAIARKLPDWAFLDAAYLFRDADHLVRAFSGEIGDAFRRDAREALNIHALSPVYLGTRHLALRAERAIRTPDDMAGMRLRVPPGEASRILGEALGAEPVAMAPGEVHDAIESGAIDGQDELLSAMRIMKLHEVATRIVLTGHVVGYDLPCVSANAWDAMTVRQRSMFARGADKAIAWNNRRHLEQEKSLVAFFRSRGLDVHKPDVDAFRARVREAYREAGLAENWPSDMLERIDAL